MKVEILSNQKEINGITLIALVVTIIVLLILAGVSIAILTGENGILTQATDAKEKTEIAEVVERVKIDIFGVQTDNKGTKITENQLKAILEKYFIDVPEKLPNDLTDLELTAKEEYGGHKINLSDIWKGDFSEGTGVKSEPAKDILKTDSSATVEKEKSPYVKYNGMLCRVLYDASSEYGIQIITDESIGLVKLGYEDESITDLNFNYTGSVILEDDFKKAAISYNQAVDKLNDKAKTYMDKKGIARNARCIGSSPDFREDSNAMFSGSESYLTTYGWNHIFKNKDNLYITDRDQLKSLELSKRISNTWLASRDIFTFSNALSLNATGFCLLCVNDESIFQCNIFNVYEDGSFSTHTYSADFHPVFALSANAKVVDGEGTKENPYILGL